MTRIITLALIMACVVFAGCSSDGDSGGIGIMHLEYRNDYRSAINLTVTVIEPESQGFRDQPTGSQVYQPGERSGLAANSCGSDDEWEEYRLVVRVDETGALLDAMTWAPLPCKHYLVSITEEGRIDLKKTGE